MIASTVMKKAMPRCLCLIVGLLICSTSISAQRRTASAMKPGQTPPTPQIVNSHLLARAGDTLAVLAERYGLSVEELSRLNRLKANSKLRKGQRIQAPSTKDSSDSPPSNRAKAAGKRIKFADGTNLDVDEVWERGEEVWYRRGGVTQSVVRKVHSIEPIFAAEPAPEFAAQSPVKPADEKANAEIPTATWISLIGGARFKVDDVKETSDGAWYSRGNLLIFLERERIARIDRDLPNSGGSGRRGMDWTSGNPLIDQLIKTNGNRFGIDPYLVFLVIEQESHFHPRAVSPKGARGLMQLMPGTAARYGVRRPFDPHENIRGGTQYLKELMGMFGGRVDLVLASYNAGEGAVVRFGRKVPPYRETQDYVRRISKRYKAGEPTDVKPEAATISARP